MGKKYSGCWPTMITPFTPDNKIDYAAVDAMVEWYIRRGSDGIFAVCQSSEMFFLSEKEKIELASHIVDKVDGRIKVIASGHTANSISQQIDQLGRMAETKVDAVVLVSNRLAGKDEGEDVFRKNAETIFSQLPEVTFGLYECPYPYLRLLTTGFLQESARNGNLIFLKDVSCSLPVLKERIAAIQGSPLAIFNANTSTLLDSLIMGADGYNGVMANYHIDIYKWLYQHFKEQPEKAREVSDFLTLTAVIEARAYPISAKYHFNATEIPMTTITRSKDVSLLNENATHEVESLIRAEKKMRRDLGLPE